MLLTATLLFVATAHAQPAPTCRAATELRAIAIPAALTRALAQVRTQLSRSTPRIEAVLGSEWIAETRELSTAGLMAAQLEAINDYNYKYTSFCRLPAVLSAIEHPDALGYGGTTHLTCDALIGDLERLDPHDPMPGTRARSAIFRTLQYQSLRVAMHRTAFIGNLILTGDFDHGLVNFTPPTAANIDTQLGALKTFSASLDDLCRARGATSRAPCTAALANMDRLIAQVNTEINEVCSTHAPDATSGSRRASGAQE